MTNDRSRSVGTVAALTIFIGLSMLASHLDLISESAAILAMILAFPAALWLGPRALRCLEWEQRRIAALSLAIFSGLCLILDAFGVGLSGSIYLGRHLLPPLSKSVLYLSLVFLGGVVIFWPRSKN